MLTNNEKDKLAQLCGLTEERYTDKVKEGAQQIYPYLEDEVAILRKAIAYLFSKNGEEGEAEFAEYNAAIEAIKARAKKDLEVNK
jgi:hypothetical protein